MLKSLIFVRKNQWQTKVRQIQWTFSEFSGYQKAVLPEIIFLRAFTRLIILILPVFGELPGISSASERETVSCYLKDLRLKKLTC
jgi:hypothetical protein